MARSNIEATEDMRSQQNATVPQIPPSVSEDDVILREDGPGLNSQTALPRIQESPHERIIPERVQPPAPATSNHTEIRSDFEPNSFANHNMTRKLLPRLPVSRALEENETTACNSAVPSNVTLEHTAALSSLTLDTDECPTRDTNVDKFKINVDVRYLGNLTTRLKGAFMSNKGQCNQSQCESYRERWQQHNLMYHQRNPSAEESGQPQHQHHHPKVFQTTASETIHVTRVSSVHATQTVQPSKHDRCIEFNVPKLSFANQVRHQSNQLVEPAKSTSMADFNNYIDHSVATSIINSILAETSESCVGCLNDTGKISEVVNLRHSTSFSVSAKSSNFPSSSEDRNTDENSSVLKIAEAVVEHKLPPRQTLYEEQLRVEIYRWLDDVPVFPDQQESAKKFREYLVKTLIQRLVENALRTTDGRHGDIIKKYVEKCVSDLPMWCPGDKDDQISFKQRLSDNLWERICLLNEKVFDVNQINFGVRISEIINWSDDSYIGHASTSRSTHVSNLEHFVGQTIEEIISLHVTRWISDDVIRIYPNHTKYDFMNLLLKSLEPFLHQRSNITFATLSKDIFEILDELPVTICSDTDKALKLYRLSEDLADVIRQHGALNERELMISPRDSFFCNRKSAISLDEFKNIIKVEATDCLQRFNIVTDEEMVNEITEILADDFESEPTRKRPEGPTKALYKALEKTELTKEELTAIILDLKSCISYLDNGWRSENSPISNTVVVFRNQPEVKNKKKNKPKSSTPNSSTTTDLETELTSRGRLRDNMLQQSTPKQGRNDISFAPDISSIRINDNLPLTHQTTRLSPDALAYLHNVEVEIEKWINSLPEMQFNTPEDLKFKRTMIKDLAADILDRARFKQLHSNTTSDADDLEHVKFIIFRWVWRISDIHPFERDDQIDNKLLRLVHALRKVPIPDLTMPYPGSRRDMKVALGQYPTGMDVLEDEISIFLDQQPPHIFLNESKDARNRLIHELATNVKEHIVNEQNPEKNIESDINQWLGKVVHPGANTDEIKVHLKERIIKVPAKVFEPPVKTRMELDIEHGVNDALEWLRKQSFYQQCTPDVKNELQLRTVAMAKSLLELSRLLPAGIITQEDKSKQILTEMVDHLKFFPIENGHRMSDHYTFAEMRKIAISLIKHLAECDKKRKQMVVQDAPQTTEIVNIWLKHIPIKIATAEAKAKFEGLKANLIASIDNLKRLKHEHSSNVLENLLKSEIKTFLQACPLDERIPNTEQARLHKAQELIDMMNDSHVTGRTDQSALSFHREDNTTAKPPCVCPTSEDQKLKEFLKENLAKFPTGDTMTREAFTNRLVKEFENINLKPCQMEGCKLNCKNLTKSGSFQQNKSINLGRFNQELVIIKSITEWLKEVPLIDQFYSPDNQDRSKMISQLAEKIYIVVSSEPNNNLYLFHIISEWMSSLPLKREMQNPMAQEALSQALRNRIERDLGHYNATHHQNEPFCSNVNESVASAKEQDSRSDEQKLEDFVENFMAMNRNIDISDELIRDAYAYKMLQALKIAIKQLKAPVNDKFELYEAMGNVPIPSDASVVRYTREMRLDKEVKEWMSLLPTVPADSKEQKWRDKQCSMVARFLAGVHEAQTHNPWHPYQKELVIKITEILDHVLEPGHKEEYMEFTNNLLRRQLAVSSENFTKAQPDYPESQNETDFDRSAALRKRYTPHEDSIDYGGFSANVPLSSSLADFQAKKLTRTSKPLDLLFQAIEEWSKEVPMEGDEETKKSLRESLVQAVMKRVGQLNMDPYIYNDNLLYIASLSDDIEEMLDGLPQNSILQTNKERLKNRLVKDISEVNVILKNVNAGENYKKKLEDTIQASLPKTTNREEKAAIDLIRTEVAEEFILDKFQNGDCNLKSQYKNKVISDLSNVLDASVFSNSDMNDFHNSIVSELENVPAPNKEAIALEVEEIKTKYIIAEWFESLPLVSPKNNQEVLDRDRIQSLLSKRLHEIEKNESDREFHMISIITKWLHKLPLHDGQERFIEDMSRNLITRLQTTEISRQATLKEVDDSSKHFTVDRQEKLTSCTKPYTSNITTLNTSKQQLTERNKNCTEIIFERVQRWCQQLPLEGSKLEEIHKNNELKTRLATNILFKVGELNRDDLIFNDEMLYSEELAEMLDKVIATLTRNENIKRNKLTLIRNLVQDIIEIRPCIKEEKDRHHYKQQLYNTVAQVVKQPQNISKVQKAGLENFQEEVVDDFIEYNFHRDEPGKNAFKEKILNESQKFLSSTGKLNPTVVTEELFQELSKVPIPSDAAVREEVQEIRVKQQISGWIEDLPAPKANAVEVQHMNKIKGVLAKRLNEIEKQGACCTTQKNMKEEITKYVKKITNNVCSETEKVNTLIERLNRTAPERRMLTPFQRVPIMQSNQCSQTSDSFFKPVSTCSGQSPQDGSAQTGRNSPFSCSAAPLSDLNHLVLQEGSVQATELMPYPGAFAHTDTLEVCSDNAILYPLYGETEPWAPCQLLSQGHQADDGQFIECPFFTSEDECPGGMGTRFAKERNSEAFKSRAKCRASKSSERVRQRPRQTYCACLNTGGLLTAVPCPIHERAVWRHPGACTAQYPGKY